MEITSTLFQALDEDSKRKKKKNTVSYQENKLAFSDIKEKHLKKKKKDIKKVGKKKKQTQTIVTGLFMPQFTILSSLIHLQYREVTEQGGKITLENSN